MLQLVNISRLYKQKKGPTVKALDEVNITFNEKGMVFVLGKSGSGKSTLLNVIGGLDKYTDGELFIKGKSTKKFKQSEFDSYRNTMVGFIFQEYNVLDEFTVGQNIGIALELQGRKATSETIDEYLTMLDMQGYGHRKPNTLSGGQKQRVAIARALVKQPEIIMADEPTGALDSKTGTALFETLKKLSAEKLVIVVTHDHEFAETYGDRIIEFSDGRIIRDVTKVHQEKTTEKQTTFTEDAIIINPRYELTEQDLKEINRYLRQKQGKSVIKVAEVGAEFIDTVSPEAPPVTEKIDLIRSRLPFKSALKMGASALKHKRFRLVLSILLASTAFTMFGLTDTMANFDPRNIATNQMTLQHVNYSTITKANHVQYDNYINNVQMTMSADDITALNAIDTNMSFYPLIELETLYMNLHIADLTSYVADPLFGNIRNSPTITYLSATDLTKAGLSMLAGNLPTNNMDIAIPDFVYRAYLKHGYKTGSGGITINITKPQDLINRPFGNFTISGVVNTKFDFDVYKDYVENVPESFFAALFGTQPASYLFSGFHYTYFTSETFFNASAQTNEYVSPEYGSWVYFNLNPLVQGLNESYWVSGLKKPLESDPIVLFDNTKALDDLTKNEIIVDRYYLDDIFPDFNSTINALVDATIYDELQNTNANDAAIEQFLKIYYAYFDMELADITPHATWDANERTLFRSTYFYALFNFDILYESNPFQPAVTGEKLFLEKLRPAIAALNIVPIDTNIVDTTGSWDTGETIYRDLKIVGISADYRDWNAYYVYVGEELAADMGLMLSGPYSSAVVHHGSNRSEISKFINLSMPRTTDLGFVYYSSNTVVDSLLMISQLMAALSKIFEIIGIIFAVFAGLLLVNFITLSVAFKKQEVGILRAIGARGIDVSTIFMNEASIIALINFTLAMIATTVISIYVNSYYQATTKSNGAILALGMRQVLLIFAISFGIALVSSFLPVFRLTLKKPIDAIKDR